MTHPDAHKAINIASEPVHSPMKNMAPSANLGSVGQAAPYGERANDHAQDEHPKSSGRHRNEDPLEEKGCASRAHRFLPNVRAVAAAVSTPQSEANQRACRRLPPAAGSVVQFSEDRWSAPDRFQAS